MDGALIQQALIDAIRVPLGSTFPVIWEQRQSLWMDPEHVKLKVLSIGTKGIDERRYGTADASGMLERVYGVRRLVVQAKVETQSQSLATSASFLADKMRTGLAFTEALDLLNAAGLGRAQSTNPRLMEYTDANDRVRSVAAVDLTFNAHTVSAERLIGWIQYVTVRGNIDDDGTFEVNLEIPTIPP